MIAYAITAIVIIAILAIPVLVYTYLVFPNFDGLAQDISWIRYDDKTQHYLYWAGFWAIIILSAIVATAVGIQSGSK